LICENCGACAIGELQELAGNLGYIVLVAEGTSVVTKLIESGKIDAVVGVSCANALERAFPHMAAGAVPGIAIPLDNDGCNSTTVDVAAVSAAITLRSPSSAPSSIDIDNLLSKVSEWFEIKRLTSILTSGKNSADPTETLALKWLSKAGKRWRPFITAAVYSALSGIRDEFPDSIIKIAIAVECFHKASLIHDDIEDGDDFRYGESTLHMLHGVPVALNVGDYLIGAGDALIADSGTSAQNIASMLGARAHCHKKHCLGQGAELTAAHGHQAPLSVRATLEVFRGKTSPAFETALTLGAICANADSELLDTLRAYSDALGTAYQIKDDIEDFTSPENNDHAAGLAERTSIIIAIAY
ncbi:MAG: polyprenyl synthetase family protein, partial [Victivallales bacterium]|nr:polyprenyl synthetase family protein [Victivallales bacterium]